VALDGRVDRRLQHAPGQQAAFLPVGGQLHREQLEHVFGGELFHFLHGAAIEPLDEHRRGRLADAAAVAVEVDLAKASAIADMQRHSHSIPAKRVLALVAMGAVFAVAAVVRVFVMRQDMLLVNFFFAGHALKNLASRASCRRDADRSQRRGKAVRYSRTRGGP
jgi:hypothetical protein